MRNVDTRNLNSVIRYAIIMVSYSYPLNFYVVQLSWTA